MQMYIVLAVTLFMMAMFVWNKIPFGVVTMTCCVVLAATGCIGVNAAFGGFANKIVVLIAPMLAMSSVLTKTALVGKISGMLDSMKNRRGIVLVLAIFAVGIIFSQFIPTTAAMAIFVVFLSTLGNTGDITANRLLLPLLGVMASWKFRTPIGLGATTFGQLNALYSGIISDPEFQIKMLDPFIFALIPGICLTIYCIFAWKLMPMDNTLNQDAVKRKETELLPQNKQMIVYVVFVLTMLVMLLNTWTGDLMYIAPAAGLLVLIYTGCISVPDAVKSLNADMTWMLAGVLVVSEAIGASGAGNLIGNALLSILGDSTSPFFVCLVFSATTVIMTTFISNMGTQSLLIPIAASICQVAGWDPRGLVLIVGTANFLAIAFPSGSAECAVTFAAGGYNPLKVLRFTFFYIVVAIISCTVAAYTLYPLY